MMYVFPIKQVTAVYHLLCGVKIKIFLVFLYREGSASILVFYAIFGGNKELL